MARHRVDVLVLGAGAAGLAAARELSQAGFTATVIEARGRMGGRILTVHDHATPVSLELGAEFIHGHAEETFRIVRAAQLLVDELPDVHYESKRGKLSPVGDFWRKTDQVRRDIGRRLGHGKSNDLTLAEYLRKAKLSRALRDLFLNFAEGYHAADADKLSARSLAMGDEETKHTSTNKQYRVLSGYDAVINWLCKCLDPERVGVRLNTVVQQIDWQPGAVIMRCSNLLGSQVEPFRAKAAIITAPEAVLKSDALRFRPELKQRRRAGEKVEIGQVFKIAMRFRPNVWMEPEFLQAPLPARDSDGLNFVHCNAAAVPVWWTASPAQVPVLTGWAGGPKAVALLDQPEKTQVETALAALTQIFSIPRRILDETVESWWTHDWGKDPFSQGAYVYVGVDGMAAQKILAKPVEQTLYFAGEATDAEQTGTVAGAIASGRRAAREVVRQFGTERNR